MSFGRWCRDGGIADDECVETPCFQLLRFTFPRDLRVNSPKVMVVLRVRNPTSALEHPSSHPWEAGEDQGCEASVEESGGSISIFFLQD